MSGCVQHPRNKVQLNNYHVNWDVTEMSGIMQSIYQNLFYKR